jgi:DNA-binding transcriptional ArsR family regulator
MSAAEIATLTPLQDVTPVATTQAAQAAARFFRGLGDPTRVRILHILLEGERTVSELVSMLGAPQGRVSSHLSCLRWCGFVEADRRGRNVYYTVADPRVRQVLQLGDAIIADAAERLLACQVLEGELADD